MSHNCYNIGKRKVQLVFRRVERRKSSADFENPHLFFATSWHPQPNFAEVPNEVYTRVPCVLPVCTMQDGESAVADISPDQAAPQP